MAKAGSRVGRLQRRLGCNTTKQKHLMPARGLCTTTPARGICTTKKTTPNACPWSSHDQQTIPNACPWALHDQRQTIPNACPWSLRDHKEQSLMPALGQGRQPCRTPPAPAQLHCGQVDGEEGRWGGRRGEGLPSDPPRPPSHPHHKDLEGGRNRSHWRLHS